MQSVQTGFIRKGTTEKDDLLGVGVRGRQHLGTALRVPAAVPQKGSGSCVDTVCAAIG